MTRLCWTACVAAGVIVSTAGTGAWGMDVHRWITERAIDGLPEPIKPFFVAERAFISEHSVDPDLWRTVDLRGDRGEEPPNHFLDMDFEEGTRAPFLNIPREYDAYVAKYGAGPANRYGRLPWRAEEIYNKLVSAFKEIGQPNAPYAADNARYFVAVLAHYVEDAHQPFHAVISYDGQATNQRGIHSRFETELVLRNQKTLALAPVKITAIPVFRDYMFQTLIDSQGLVDGVLAADRKATEGREFYDAAYFDVLLTGVKPVLERRLSEAASGVASAVFSAWAEAGRPVLPAGGVRAPARIRR
jgi:hypothetical protein